MSDNLPTIEHATVFYNQYGSITVQMDSGYVFYRSDLFPEETPAEEMAYSRRGYFPTDFDFSYIVVVAESDVPADQIYGDVTPPTETI